MIFMSNMMNVRNSRPGKRISPRLNDRQKRAPKLLLIVKIMFETYNFVSFAVFLKYGCIIV